MAVIICVSSLMRTGSHEALNPSSAIPAAYGASVPGICLSRYWASYADHQGPRRNGRRQRYRGLPSRYRHNVFEPQEKAVSDKPPTHQPILVCRSSLGIVYVLRGGFAGCSNVERNTDHHYPGHL